MIDHKQYGDIAFSRDTSQYFGSVHPKLWAAAGIEMTVAGNTTKEQ